MAYSSCDFVDSIEECLDVNIPDRLNDHISEQADICIEKIEWLKESRKTLFASTKELTDWIGSLVDSNNLDEDSRAILQRADEAIKLAETSPPDWPDEEPDDEEEPTRLDWAREVQNGDTLLGFGEWKAHKKEADSAWSQL